MYMVYRVTFDRPSVDRGDNIIAIYSRRAGAILRLEQLAHANPGVLYCAGWLPEGVKPEFANITRCEMSLSVVPESEVSNVQAQ